MIKLFLSILQVKYLSNIKPIPFNSFAKQKKTHLESQMDQHIILFVSNHTFFFAYTTYLPASITRLAILRFSSTKLIGL
jgi:hypothetical protein